MDERYEIRVLGRLGPALRAAFPAMRCRILSPQTVIRGRLSGDELRELLKRMDKSQVMLVDLHCTPP